MSPIGVEVGVDLLATLLITLKDAVPDLLQNCIFARQILQESFCEQLCQIVLGDAGPSLEDWVELTADLGVD